MAVFNSLRKVTQFPLQYNGRQLPPAPQLSPRIPAYPVPPGQVGKPWRSDWDLNRAVAMGYLQSVWVYRAVNAIAQNQARLPMIMRQGNPIDGQLVDHPSLDLFNFKSSDYYSTMIFRKRLSQVLILNKQGAFVEVIWNNLGEPIALHLLPPGYTWPIPSESTFVSAYRVQFPGLGWYDVPPGNVLWIRDPHPTEAYEGITPLEAAGLSIESDYYARQLNRNFLMNDGRPGGILLMKGQLDDIEAQKIKSRFMGPSGWGAGGAGRLVVMEAEDGQYIDTSTTQRDGQYAELRQLTKEEILLAIGVPESVAGNASGRCLRATETVQLADGTHAIARDLIGTRFELQTSTPTGVVTAQAWATAEAVEQCYRVTTQSGRTVEANGKHPLYVGHKSRLSGQKVNVDVRGWTPLKDIDVGKDWLIAVPSAIEIDQDEITPLDLDAAAILGHLIGDGSLSSAKNFISLTTPRGPQSDDFVRACEALGDRVTKYETGNRVDSWGVKDGQVRKLVHAAGMIGHTAHTKRIPQMVWASQREAQAIFLNRYFSADGYAYAPKEDDSTTPARISLVTVSPDLSQDVQELLLRFGINATIRFREAKGGIASMGGRTFGSWEVTIARADDIDVFVREIGIIGKEEALTRVHKQALRRMDNHRFSTFGWETSGLNPGLRWEYVRSIEPTDVDQTVGIAVPGHHTYLGTIFQHNTFDNADAEREGFWLDTMLDHLNLIARPLDELDPAPDLFYDFDLSRVDVLQRQTTAQKTQMLAEVTGNVRSKDEYRIKSGLVPVGGGAAKLYSPSMLVEVADTTLVEDPDKEQNPNAFSPAIETTSLHARSPESKVDRGAVDWHNSDGRSPAASRGALVDHLRRVHGLPGPFPRDVDEVDELHYQDHNWNGECGAHEAGDRTDPPGIPATGRKDMGAASGIGITSDSPVGGNPEGFRPIDRGGVAPEAHRKPLERRRRKPKVERIDSEEPEGKAPASGPGLPPGRRAA